MANYEATKYDFSGANLQGLQGVNTGIIVPWSNASVPSGFLECNGAAVSRSTYAALFAVVGTTYGVGDGSTTFNVPDLTDRVALGKSPTFSLASTGGADSVTATGNISGSSDGTALTTPTIAAHLHTGGGFLTNQSWAFAAGTVPEGQTFQSAWSPSGNITLDNAGGGSTHTHPLSVNFTGGADSVLQPYLTVMYIIKT